MKTLLVAAAVIGFSAASASAECSYHSVKAKPDPTTTASVATEQAKMSAPADTQTAEQKILPKEDEK